MRRFPGLFTILAALLLASPAHAKDKDKDDDDDEVEVEKPLDVDEGDFKDGGDPDAEPPPKRIDEDDKEEADGDELDFEDDEKDDDDLKFTDEDEQASVKPREAGEDTAQLYRDTQKKAKDMTPDEEQLLWEEYLRKYPKSLFRDRIDTRMEELSALMFGERVPGSDKGAGGIDAAERELNFAVPIHLSPIDTRSHATVGFQWGFPNWFSLNLDAEYAIRRNFSVHAGVKRDFNGWAISPGAKYAIIKSSRTGTILSGGLDLKLNAGPFYGAIHPVVGFGQRIRVLKGLDVSVQAGADIELREDSDIRYTFGLQSQLQANEIVSVFWEWGWDAKYLAPADNFNTFTFFTTTFGLKFTAAKANNSQGDGRIDAGIAAAFPYATNYWGFYAGGVNVFGDMYF